MAKQLDARQLEILKKYHPDPKSAVWDCHGVLVIYHKAIEIIAAKAGITFDQPHEAEMNSEKKIAVIRVTGHLGDRSEWSYGEAAPSNNKNSYPVSMAEKRGKDRVVLKLLNLHGDIYAEDEADAFKDVTVTITQNSVAAPVTEAIDYASEDESKTQRDKLIAEITSLATLKALNTWGVTNAERISKLLEADQEALREIYSDQKQRLAAKAA